jgi:hypothetical protein
VNSSAVIRVAAIFSFLSPLCIVAAVPIAGSLRGLGGPGPIDFGNGVLLMQLAMAAPGPVWVDTLALLSPVFALPIGAGWYLILKEKGSLVALGMLLWYLGMVFVITQDALQLALVTKLPPAYVAANESVRLALEAFGGSFAYIIDVLSMVGLVSYAGFAIVCIPMMSSSRIPKWIAVLCLVSNVIPILSVCIQWVLPQVGLLRLGLPVEILVFVLVCIPALGVVMWRWKSDQVI